MMAMTQEEIEYAVIKNMMASLAVMCAADENKIIDLLTGYLWDEKEAGCIKESDGNYQIFKN